MMIVDMTPKMIEALTIANDTGGVIAGLTVIDGRSVRISASTIRALASRGKLTLHLSPDGGMMGRPICDQEDGCP